jgi:hypothetical protein
MSESTDSKAPAFRALKQITLSETLIIAAVPFAAYVVLFVYRAGYFDVYKLPIQFISFNLAEVFIVAGALGGVILIVFGVANFVLTFLPSKWHTPSVIERFWRILPMFILAVAFAFLYSEQSSVWVVFLAFLVIMLAIMFLPPLFSRQIQGSYLEKMAILDQQRPATDGMWKTSLVYRTAAFFGPHFIIVVFYTWIFLYVTYNAGYASALNQRMFRIATTSPEMVVLYMTDDKIIAAPFDRNTKLVEPSFAVLDTNDGTNVTYRLEEVGPLQLKQVSNGQVSSPVATPLPASLQPPTPVASP